MGPSRWLARIIYNSLEFSDKHQDNCMYFSLFSSFQYLFPSSLLVDNLFHWTKWCNQISSVYSHHSVSTYQHLWQCTLTSFLFQWLNSWCLTPTHAPHPVLSNLLKNISLAISFTVLYIVKSYPHLHYYISIQISYSSHYL